MERFEQITLVANPVAQNGAGAAAAQKAYQALCGRYGATRVTLVLTQAPGHAAELAREASRLGTDAVVVLGGDGALHEAVNGLMEIDAGQRPALGLIPLGSGNDYARSIGMPEGVDAAIGALRDAVARPVDVGIVNGVYFAETLSFGLDAAIALGTVDQRKVSGHTGTRLYMEVGFDQLAHHLDLYSYRAQVENGAKVVYRGKYASEVGPLSGAFPPLGPLVSDAPQSPRSVSGSASGSANGTAGGSVATGETHDTLTDVDAQCLLFAVQVGPTYGGGFHICPDARLDDGKLDVCIAHPPLSLPRAVGIFLLAKNGNHTGFKQMEFFRCTGMTLRFNAPIPTQVDGERLVADEYEIGIVPQALRVLRLG